MNVDLVVIGAGLSGCALVGRLHQIGWSGSMAIVEAGRGPGGRCATRRRRDDPDWRLDHGAPGLNFLGPVDERLEALLQPLRTSGVLRPEWGAITAVDSCGALLDPPEHPLLLGEQWRAHPTMAHLCEALLPTSNANVEMLFGRRVRRLVWERSSWILYDEAGELIVQAKALVLSGSLLAHPRSLAMLSWRDVPLRSAIAEGQDPQVDRVLACLAASQSAVRWNLMLALPALHSVDAATELPRQIWLSAEAQDCFEIERLVLHPQADGGLGVVVHGLDPGLEITPESQPSLLAERERRLQQGLSTILRPWPSLVDALNHKRVQGVMRWGASQPLNQPLPAALQWCPHSALGLCGDWIEGQGFGHAEGALLSAVALADTLQAAR